MALLHIAEIEHDLADVGAALRAVTVAVQTRGSRSGQGSGILWDAGGTIVTNAHVVHGDAARVTLADGRAMEARVIAWDPRRDLAVLRLDRAESAGVPLPVARVGDPSRLRAGELVVALGHPLGVPHALALGAVHVAGSPRALHVVADIRLAPGNSGGPLADAQGRVIGVNSMVVGGLGVAVSVNAVRRLLDAVASRERRAA